MLLAKEDVINTVWNFLFFYFFKKKEKWQLERGGKVERSVILPISHQAMIWDSSLRTYKQLNVRLHWRWQAHLQMDSLHGGQDRGAGMERGIRTYKWRWKEKKNEWGTERLRGNKERWMERGRTSDRNRRWERSAEVTLEGVEKRGNQC